MRTEVLITPRTNRLFSSLRNLGVQPGSYVIALSSPERIGAVSQVFLDTRHRGGLLSWEGILPGEDRDTRLEDKARFLAELAEYGVELERIAEVGRSKAWSTAVAKVLRDL